MATHPILTWQLPEWQEKHTADAVANANSEVSQIVGVPILETPPLNIADLTTIASASPEARQYAAFNAGLGEQLFANAEGVAGGLDALAGTFADDDFDSGDEIDISALATAVGTQAAASGISSETITQAVAVIESSITDGAYDPEPTDSAALPAIALVAETRTLVNSIEALDDPIGAFDMGLNVAAEVIDVNAQVLLEVAGMVIQSVLDTIDSGDLPLGESANVDVLNSEGLLVGTVHAALGNNSGLTISTPSTTLVGVSVTIALNMTSNILASWFC